MWRGSWLLLIECSTLDVAVFFMVYYLILLNTVAMESMRTPAGQSSGTALGLLLECDQESVYSIWTPCGGQVEAMWTLKDLFP